MRTYRAVGALLVFVATAVAPGPSPYAMAISDIDGDGSLDLVAVTGAVDEVVVRLRSACSRW